MSKKCNLPFDLMAVISCDSQAARNTGIVRILARISCACAGSLIRLGMPLLGAEYSDIRQF